MPRNLFLARPLPQLPNEIKSMIVEYLGTLTHPLAFELPRYSQAALLALCSTNKAFHGWAEPLLYRHISIHPSNIALLNNTLCYYEGSYRPPQRPLPVRKVISLRIKGAYPTLAYVPDSEQLKELQYLLEHCAPTLERLSSQVALSWITYRVFQAVNMPKLSCCVVHPALTVPLPNLHGQACHVAIYPFHRDVTTMTALDYQGLLRSLFPCHVRQILVAGLSLPRDTRSLSGAIRDLLRQHTELERVLLFPLLTLFPGWSGLSPMPELVNSLSAALENEPELKSKIQVAKIPKEVFDTSLWIYGKLLDGTAWNLEGMAYTHPEVVGRWF